MFYTIILIILACLVLQHFYDYGYKAAVRDLIKEEIVKDMYVDAFKEIFSIK